jgi:hypothetical protein
MILHLKPNFVDALSDFDEVIERLAFTYHFHAYPGVFNRLQVETGRQHPSRGAGEEEQDEKEGVTLWHSENNQPRKNVADSFKNESEFFNLSEKFHSKQVSQKFLFQFEMWTKHVDPDIKASTGQRLAGWGCIIYFPQRLTENGLQETNPYSKKSDEDTEKPTYLTDTKIHCYWNQRNVPRSNLKTLPFFPEWSTSKKFPQNWQVIYIKMVDRSNGTSCRIECKASCSSGHPSQSAILS